MAHKKKAECVFAGVQFALYFLRERSLVAKKKRTIKAMVNRYCRCDAGPAPQFLSKGVTRGDRAVSPAEGLPGKKTFDPGVQPKSIIASAANIARKIFRCVKRIPRKKELRNRRISQREVSCRD